MAQLYLVGGGEDGAADAGRQRGHPVVQLLVLGLGQASLEALDDVVEVELVELVVQSLAIVFAKLVPESELQVSIQNSNVIKTFMRLLSS